MVGLMVEAAIAAHGQPNQDLGDCGKLQIYIS